MAAGSIELNRIRRPPPLNTVRFFTTEDQQPPSPQVRDDQNRPFAASTSYEEGDPTSSAHIHPPWKRSLYKLLEQPTSSSSAFAIHMLTTFLIVFSAFITVLETVPAVHSISMRVWFGVETSVVALFTVEYITRCLAWSSTWSTLFSWMFSFYGVIDLLSVLPYYLELLLQQDTSVYFRFSILRMFRLLRVFRPFRYNHTILLTIEVMYLSVRRSQHALLAIGFFVIMILTVFSTLLYFAERKTWDELLGTFINSDGDPTQFSSIPAAAWFVLVTITTVGYGEITPRSFLGRLITLPILVFGLLLITLPSFVLGREFSHVWEKMTTDRPSSDANGDGGEQGSGRGRENPTISPYSPISYPMSAISRPSIDAPGRTPYYPRTPSHSHSSSTGIRQRDLSNLKLAQNQTELSRQIEELRETMEAQGKLLMRLLERMEGKGAANETAGGFSHGMEGLGGGGAKGSKES
ncbi:voltage-gated potassium channel [Agrocybe pediades]|nr:voltage-gated potassium channel [Agrocybe pediades]